MNRDAILGQNHEAHHEFPEHAERIDKMRARNPEFAELVDRYNDLNREVIRIEQGIEPRDHFSFEALKKERLLHKDKLYQMLST